ncbi:uncharacterized protein TNCV_2082341 [Trichonephila clavipes]|nr:uncharacterized protein TNCV_2082341 [Trichonephila clavipes]
MPRASTKVFKKRRGVFNKGRCNKSNDGCGESNSTVPKNSADEKIVLMVQSFVLMKLNHLPATRETCERSMAEAVREAVDENDGKRDLAVAVEGDGDSKAFTSIVENKVYGDHCSVEKLECIGHVMKRMGTRLRRLKTKMRGQKLSDGKPLCGRNRLTEAEIDRLQAYYGLAIRRNLSSVKDMQQAIWAIFLHKLSTDEKTQHGFCPSDSDTWCKFKKAELLGETYHHKNSLPVDVVEAMRPAFRDLANPELLKKCLHGGTQNPKESVNNVIWSRVPKKTFVQLEVLSLGDGVPRQTEAVTSKILLFTKTKEVRQEKRLKRKKEDDELLKMLMI